MLRRHVTRHLSAYLHGELADAERRRVEVHLTTCAHCRDIYEEVRFGAQLASSLTITTAPDLGVGDFPSLAKEGPGVVRSIPRTMLFPIGAAVTVIVALFWFGVRHSPNSASGGPAWTVETAQGTRLLETGQTLQTDASSQATVAIANIGRLFVDPNTRLRLIVTKSDEHRIALERGRVQALTWAPPRLFIIDTPSASAVDWGCQYTLEVQKDGSSLLQVTLGMVSLENRGRSAFVPAHFMARTQPGAGPGTPYREDASARMKDALNAIDFGDARLREAQSDVVLTEATDADAVTLWHLLPRVAARARETIYDRLAAIFPPPPQVTRSDILSLDARKLRAWGETIPELWWMARENARENNQ